MVAQGIGPVAIGADEIALNRVVVGFRGIAPEDRDAAVAVTRDDVARATELAKARVATAADLVAGRTVVDLQALRPLPKPATPVMSVPIRFPSTTLLFVPGSVIKTPSVALLESRLPVPTAVPPTVLAAAP